MLSTNHSKLYLASTRSKVPLLLDISNTLELNADTSEAIFAGDKCEDWSYCQFPIKTLTPLLRMDSNGGFARLLKRSGGCRPEAGITTVNSRLCCLPTASNFPWGGNRQLWFLIPNSSTECLLLSVYCHHNLALSTWMLTLSDPKKAQLKTFLYKVSCSWATCCDDMDT